MGVHDEKVQRALCDREPEARQEVIPLTTRVPYGPHQRLTACINPGMAQINVTVRKNHVTGAGIDGVFAAEVSREGDGSREEACSPPTV